MDILTVWGNETEKVGVECRVRLYHHLCNSCKKYGCRSDGFLLRLHVSGRKCPGESGWVFWWWPSISAVVCHALSNRAPCYIVCRSTLKLRDLTNLQLVRSRKLDITSGRLPSTWAAWHRLHVDSRGEKRRARSHEQYLRLSFEIRRPQTDQADGREGVQKIEQQRQAGQ